MSYPDALDRERGHNLCCFRTGDDMFGIATFAVREVLGHCELHEVPLAPKFVAGMLAYRGEVLLAVSFRTLLGLAPRTEASSAVVLQDTETCELFALLLDELLDVVRVADNAWEPNPATLDDRSSLLFAGLYRMPGAPLVLLEPERVQPSSLMRHLDSWMRIGEQR